MIVEITSWAPTVAFSSPAIPAHTAPANAAASTASAMCRSFGVPPSEDPTQTAANEPTRY